jgi:hypothetical protein
LLVTCILLIFLSGCLGPSPEEKIYSILEKVVTLEDSFKEQQEPLLELEKKESELYNQIMDLGMKEFDKVITLSKEALDLVEERETKINKEYESIMSSKEEFTAITEEIEKIKDENLAKQASELKSTMEDRYSTYESLYKSYKTSISHDKELYIMLQKEDLTLEGLEAQIKKVNDSYKSVMEHNEEFNKLTEEFNKSKMEFYEKAELNVKESK